MTREEIARFALALREADRVRAMIAAEETAERDDGAATKEIPPLAA